MGTRWLRDLLIVMLHILSTAVIGGQLRRSVSPWGWTHQDPSDIVLNQISAKMVTKMFKKNEVDGAFLRVI